MIARTAIARRILVVEDHRDTAEALVKLLTMRGHYLSVAGTLADAKRLCAEETFDLVLCDIGLPDGSGLDLAAIVKAHCPGAKVLALTGYGMPQEVREIQAAGFDAHLLKPITFDTLL